MKWLRQGERVTDESATEFRGQLYQCPRGHDLWWFDPWRQRWHASPDAV
ncbi:MAG: hypothetical protein JNM38_01395 [Acidobacteria bacterium]|nr:hypothetical protein [Acidobacteriota bacterium]